MKKYILLSSKPWHKKLFQDLSKIKSTKWVFINDKNKFNFSNVKKINPEIIFIPHWSEIIDYEIFTRYNCVVFHMTDLPYGRGGSPLQNLIVRKIKKTKISALKVEKGIDTGPIYLKADLSLEGTALEIFKRSVPIIKRMILKIMNSDIQPTKQNGKIVKFKRRKPSDGNLKELLELEDAYDFIRMLDVESYPNAFLENNELKYSFYNAKFDKKNNIIEANVRIIKK